VVNRNLDTAAVAGREPAKRKRLQALVQEAWDLGVSEICMQGPLPPDADDDYLSLIDAVLEQEPGLHLHAFRPAELLDGAARASMPLEMFLKAAKDSGLGSVPGTAARVLDDAVRTRMMGRPDLPVARWVEVIETAHRAGLPSTSTLVFGHIETPAQQVAHLRLLAGIQQRTHGFTEFIAMPYVPAAAHVTAPGLAAEKNLTGPDWRQSRALHAVARLILHGSIDNIQAAWPKYGLDASVQLLRGGANDIGGLLLDGRLAPDAGAEAGLTLTTDDIAKAAQELGRTPRRRNTVYGEMRLWRRPRTCLTATRRRRSTCSSSAPASRGSAWASSWPARTASRSSSSSRPMTSAAPGGTTGTPGSPATSRATCTRSRSAPTPAGPGCSPKDGRSTTTSATA
jgi:FO synthase